MSFGEAAGIFSLGIIGLVALIVVLLIIIELLPGDVTR